MSTSPSLASPPPASPTPSSPHPHTTLKDFLASLAAIRGDLSNITAPPFVLDTKSVVELPSFWADRPSFFTSPASAADPAQRALLVLRWFLVSLRNQQYSGRADGEGVRKPLNAFLGECFLASWDDNNDNDKTNLVVEQVSHHPPVTACRLWNDKHGVYAEGFTRQEITLSLAGAVTVRQIGHALLSLRHHNDETYLIPLPDVKVKGLLTGGLTGSYPELDGTWMIPCTSGYYSVLDFHGKASSLLPSSLTGGAATTESNKKNAFTARLYAPGASAHQSDPLYTITGHWNEAFTIYRGAETTPSTAMEKLVLSNLPTTAMKLDDDDDADPWESRRAWKDVREALLRGDMLAAAKAKSVVEQGQREMRKEEVRSGEKWEALFFRAQETDEVAASLYRSILKELKPEATVAIWKFDEEKWERGLITKPFHGDLMPDNSHTAASQSNGKPVLPAIVAQRAVGDAQEHYKNGEDDSTLASPASFQTAHEYFPTKPAPEEPRATMASTLAPPIQPSTPLKKQSADQRSGSPGGELTPSTASVSPSTRRGKRQRARDSIGKFTSSFSSGLSKLSPSQKAKNGEEKS